MRLKDQIIASFENAVVEEDNAPRIEASTIDAETQEIIDERVAVAEQLAESEAETQEVRDVEEQLEQDIESVENYILMLKQPTALSQESYNMALIGMDNIFKRYGIAKALPSVESFGEGSKDQLVTSLEGVAAKLWEGLKNTGQKALEVFTKRLPANIKAKQNAIARLRAIQTNGEGGETDVNGNPFGIVTKSADIENVIDNTVEVLNQIAKAKDTHLAHYEKEIAAMENSKWWDRFNATKDVLEYLSTDSSEFVKAVYASKEDKGVVEYRTKDLIGGVYGFDAEIKDGEQLRLTAVDAVRSGTSATKVEMTTKASDLAAKLADALEASLAFEEDKKRIDEAFSTWKGLFSVNWKALLASTAVAAAFVGATVVTGGGAAGAGAIAAAGGAGAAAGSLAASSALSSVFKVIRTWIMEPVAAPNNGIVSQLNKVVSYLEASAKPAPATAE